MQTLIVHHHEPFSHPGGSSDQLGATESLLGVRSHDCSVTTLRGHSPVRLGRPTWAVGVRYTRPGSDLRDLRKAVHAHEHNRWVHTSWLTSPKAVTSCAEYALAWRASLEVLYEGRAKTLKRYAATPSLSSVHRLSSYRELLNHRSAFPVNSGQRGTNGGCHMCRNTWEWRAVPEHEPEDQPSLHWSTRTPQT